jgi:phospho-N-acetylmuramoyl-pentapeptide-transferase
MGGICFITGMLLVLLAVAIIFFVNGKQNQLIPLALTLCLALANGLIGLLDDYKKLLRKENEGLTAQQKFLLQCLVAALYLVVLTVTDNIDTSIHIPFTDIMLELGIGYYAAAMLFIVGIVNSVNLTDGVDGLATSMTIVVTAFIAFVGLNYLNVSMTLLAALLMGSLLAFLRKNCHVADVFMGDTGSLFLGGALAGAAFVINDMFAVAIGCGMFVFEMITVIIQVVVFKASGRKKRVFKMTPIHHHYELSGWSENKIVLVFGAITLALCVTAWFAL